MRKQTVGALLSLLVVLANCTPQAQALRSLPEAMTVRAGQTINLSVGFPFKVEQRADAASVSVFGAVVKEVELRVAPERLLIPGGQSIGAALTMRGVLVVGTGSVEGGVSPAKDAGLRPGDLILGVEGAEVLSASQLTELVGRAGAGTLSVRFLRDGKEDTALVRPSLDPLDGRARLGLWVRDSTAGVGTLSFFDPQTMRYGALGHAITDLDTGVTLPVRSGSLLESRVVSIRKGERGTPGELQGSFLRDSVELGDIRANTSFGIFGALDTPVSNSLYPDGLPIGAQALVRTGEASILTTLGEDGVREYAVEITRVSRQRSASQRSISLRVTDPELLERTGGIVQGMSGSPILQDGRIIGAVTHVFVSDPTQGYGVFIEWMLEQADRV